MNIDLAAFRLHALGTLTANGATHAGKTASTSDFLTTLMAAQAKTALPRAAHASTGTNPLRALHTDPLSGVSSVLAQLEASNAAFMQRYATRVQEIGDEAAVLNRLRDRMGELGDASKTLTTLDAETETVALKDTLRSFIARYNAWDTEFDPYFDRGGSLHDTAAGSVVRFSLQREVGSIFHGKGNDGYQQGLSDMGVRVAADGQLIFDEAAFDAALTSNRKAAVQTLHNVGKAFGDAADMLAADGHMLDRRIDNAERAVRWAADNQTSLEAEFGPGALSTRLQGRLG